MTTTSLIRITLESKISVDSHDIGDKVVMMEVAPDTTVSGLKQRIRDVLMVPISLQNIFAADEVIDDDVVLATLLKDNAIVAGVTASLDPWLDQLQEGLWENTRVIPADFKLLGQILKHTDAADERVQRALLRQLCDLDPDSSLARRIGMDVLKDASKPGDEAVTDIAVNHLGNIDAFVRRSALAAVHRLAEKDNEEIVNAIVACLDDRDIDIRLSAADVLVDMVTTDDERVLELILPRLEGRGKEGRCSALNALSRLVRRRCDGEWPGENRVFKGIHDRLEDKAPVVRKAALDAVANVAERGNESAIAAVMACLEDTDAEVKAAATQAMVKLCHRGDKRAIRSVGLSLGNDDYMERLRAVKLLSTMADRGDPNVIEVVCSQLAHKAYSVRLAASKALMQVAAKGDKSAVDSLTSLLKHPDAHARIEAANILPKLVGSSTVLVIKALERCAEDEDPVVKDAATNALAAVVKQVEDELVYL